MSRYERLWLYLKDNNLDEYKMSFEEINNILGFSIDHSFLKYKKSIRILSFPNAFNINIFNTFRSLDQSHYPRSPPEH